MKPIALITGASSGIGAALAYLFSAENYNVVLVARRQEKLQEIAADLEQRFDNKAWIIAQDLSETNAAQTIFDQLKEKDVNVNVLVNNAGLGLRGKFTDQAWENDFQMMQVNMIALTQLTKLFANDMLEQKARSTGDEKRMPYKIMNIASLAAFQPGPHMAVYFATKSFVLSFSEAIAEELKHSGIGVTTICPGVTRTDFLENAQLSLSESNNRYTDWITQSAEEVAKEAYDAMCQNKRVHITGGVVNNLSATAATLVPNRILNPLTGWFIENIGGGKDVW